MHVRPKTAAKELGISVSTLRTYADKGFIEYIWTSGGQRRYDVSSMQSNQTKSGGREQIPAYNARRSQQKEEKENLQSSQGAIYARVSSYKQKDDLQRQIEALQKDYPNYQIFKDICSGLKFKRKGLTRLLEQVQRGTIKEVVVAHKDRLARFATDLIEWILQQAGASLRILNHDKLSPQQELTEDLMAIVHVFSCRFNGKRKYQSTEPSGKKRKKQSLQGPDAGTKEYSEGPIRPETTRESQEMSTNRIGFGPKATQAVNEVVLGRQEDLQSGD